VRVRPSGERAVTKSKLCAVVTVLCWSAVIFADSVTTQQRTVTKLADGVYTIRHKDSPDGNLNGNTTVVIGDKEVLVVDSCFQLPAAREDVAQIRQWTNKPVRYLLITHFHNDHNMGSGVYSAAYPGMDVIAQTATKRDMYRTPVTPSRFVQQIAVREERLRTGNGADGKPMTDAQIAHTKQNLEGKKQVLEELKDFVYQAPTVTFDHEMNIDLGNREVQILHLGRGTTQGDAFVYLPKEKILIAGDLVTHPVLYTYDGYPSEWIETLERMARLDFETVVPGHGEVLRGKDFIYLCRDLLKSAVDQVHGQMEKLTAKIENPPLEDVQKGVDLSAFRTRFAGQDKDTIEQFDDAAAALVRISYREAMHNH
jgi:cyclase